MSLKHYLFLIITLFVLLLGGVQLGFIHYMKQQMNAEIEQKSKALSSKAIDLLVSKMQMQLPSETTTPELNNWIIKIQPTPARKVDLGNGYEFITGAGTQTLQITRARHTKPDHIKLQNDPAQSQDSLRTHLRQLSISSLSDTLAFSVGINGPQQVHQHIVQFNQRDSRLARYTSGLIFGIAFVCIAGVILAYWLAHSISSPLGRLAKGFNTLAKGQFGSQVKVSGIAELRSILSRYNLMSARLAELQELERTFEQQRQLAELGEVARGLAHTLRNPLNSIGLILEQLAAQNTYPNLSAELAEQGRRKIEHLDNTIKSLLSLTAADINRSDEINVSNIINDILMELSMSHSVPVQLDVADNVTIQGAESEIRAMLHTLLVNALEASDSGQTVAVSTEYDEDFLLIKVRDHGQGLQEDVANRLFEPHVSDKAEGAGMGLYIAKRICQSFYQGDLNLQNNMDAGCTATLKLMRYQHSNTNKGEHLG